MQSTLRKKIIRGVTLFLIVYLIGALIIYFFHTKLLLQPKKLDAIYEYNFKAPFREINLPVNEEKNINIIQFTVADSLRRGVVLYFHGNKENINHYAAFASNFTNNNYEIWMMDYPGFGKSTGECSEQTLYEDAAIVYQMARARFAKDSIVIYGKSLGSGIAAWLAAHKDSKQLILESPYYSMDALLQHYLFIYPMQWLNKYHFPTNEYLSEVEVPVSIFHGTEDEVIPYKQSVKLQSAHLQAALITIPEGKHNNLNEFPLFHKKLNELLSGQK